MSRDPYLGLPGYDAWKLATPPEYEVTPEQERLMEDIEATEQAVEEARDALVGAACVWADLWHDQCCTPARFTIENEDALAAAEAKLWNAVNELRDAVADYDEAMEAGHDHPGI